MNVKQVIIIKSIKNGVNNMTVKVKRLKDTATTPTRGSEKAAGYDLYACIDEGSVTIPPHETVKIGTGLAFEVPDGYFGAIYARSGLATKQGLRPANCVGVADSDYRGEYIVALYNDSQENRIVSHGDRIAQLVILPYLACEFMEAEELESTKRADGGFGSTGK